jgi:hypothetical protein
MLAASLPTRSKVYSAYAVSELVPVLAFPPASYPPYPISTSCPLTWTEPSLQRHGRANPPHRTNYRTDGDYSEGTQQAGVIRAYMYCV